MMRNASIRTATIDDLKAITLIEQSVPYPTWSIDNFLDELNINQDNFWLLTDDETDLRIYGYLIFRQNDSYVDILNLAIFEKYQKKGYAYYLVQKLIQKSIKQGFSKVFLEVRKGNESAIQFYQKVGFVITRVLKKYYKNQEDAYQMELIIDDN